MKKIKYAIVLKPIPVPGIEEQMPITSVIELDHTYPIDKREHQIIYKSGSAYGSVGDRCCSITEKQLLQLKIDGFIRFCF